VRSMQRRDGIKQESHHGPVVSGRFMQTLARQNYIGIDTETMVTKQSEGFLVHSLKDTAFLPYER
jgi:hypothetical protein